VKLAWTLEALADRHAIYSYVEVDNPKAALALDQLISEKATYLVNYPNMGRIGRLDGTRELIAHSNYMLIYDIADEFVRILRVLHTSQQWPGLR
jgi:addiction module RelE/StbE family toxin